MRRRFARRLNAVVTTDTISKDVHMRKISRQPGVRYMAVIAGIVAGDMRWMFAGCRNTVVTANAIADDIAVVEESRQPGRCIVAVVALIAGGNMGWRLTRSLHTVMARNATSGHRCVVHKCDRRPCHGRVAVSTLVGRHDMIRRLE